MPATDIRQEFAPPHTPGMLRALMLALLAHAALVAVLAVGVAWKRELPPVTVEAELWSAIPQEAAPPPPEEIPPEPETTPQPAVKPQPEPPPMVKQAVPEAPSKADIALAKDKERQIEAQKAKELQAKLEMERKALEKRQQNQAAKDKLEKERATQAKLKEQQEKEKLSKANAAREAKEKANKAEKGAKEDAKRAERERQQQLSRLTGLAGAAGSGSDNSTGTAAKSAGPGASYTGRIQAAVKPNITFTDTIVGNPKTEIEVTLASNGEILSKRITKRSGNKAWDDAAENAIDKTRKLPLDDGKVWSPMVIVISPQTLVGQ